MRSNPKHAKVHAVLEPLPRAKPRHKLFRLRPAAQTLALIRRCNSHVLCLLFVSLSVLLPCKTIRVPGVRSKFIMRCELLSRGYRTTKQSIVTLRFIQIELAEGCEEIRFGVPTAVPHQHNIFWHPCVAALFMQKQYTICCPARFRV